ncbi:hypothetical protein PBRA_002475 [Plasmodiophora brassicae]|uniref:Uncharacterized protein n=1 Tax=Plasmodiophora brassicae TaxID=37360 RepID=A0A0G4J3T3_PLABS|nr:hypothetical protein PBRA_002475 [Plasmodiophora brassicae]
MSTSAEIHSTDQECIQCWVVRYVRATNNRPLTGDVMLRIATDVVLSISDANVLQRPQDVHDAAGWIADSLVAACECGAPSPVLAERFMRALTEMVAQMVTFDCLKLDSFKESTSPGIVAGSSPLRDVRLQLHSFIVALGKRGCLTDVLLSLCCAELLSVFRPERTGSDRDWLILSQNSAYLCRCIEQLIGMRSQMEEYPVCEALSSLISYIPGLRPWVDIWQDILPLAADCRSVSPLVTSQVWRITALLDGGAGLAWTTALSTIRSQTGDR